MKKKCKICNDTGYTGETDRCVPPNLYYCHCEAGKKKAEYAEICFVSKDAKNPWQRSLSIEQFSAEIIDWAKRRKKAMRTPVKDEWHQGYETALDDVMLKVAHASGIIDEVKDEE